MSNSGLLWELFARTARGAPMIVSSNWAAYLISGVIVVFNFAWTFFSDSTSPWRERMREVLKSKKKDALRGAIMLAIFWGILFSASFVHVLYEDRVSLNAAMNEKKTLQDQNEGLARKNEELQKYLPTAESVDSLRRRTVRLANEYSDFWVKNPGPPYPSVQNPVTEQDIKRQKVWDEYWRRVTAVYDRKYKDRIIGTIREYKTKGIPTGYLEAAAENHVFAASPFSQTGFLVPTCSQDELCQFRELAYHVDAKDQMIGTDF